MSIGLPPSSKRRRIDLTSDTQSIYSYNSNTNVDFRDKSDINSINKSSSSSATSTYYKSIDIGYHNKNHNSNKIVPIMETRSLLEHIHTFLALEEILSSRQICKLWNEYFKIKISPSSWSVNGNDCNIFPLYMREMFSKSIGKFEHWLLFFICEYRNIEFKLIHKIKSSVIYPNKVVNCYPHKTRFNVINTQEYKLYEKLLTIFMFERHKNKNNITLHNILFAWLRGLKPLALFWLDLYDIKKLNADLEVFHKQLSIDYIECEYGSIPLLHNVLLTKFDFLSSYLGLITLNGDFKLFSKLLCKIENNSSDLLTYFPKQHYPNHVYLHRHTFGFGYNVYGLCDIKLIDIALKICDIPRSVCSLKIIRFVIQPHILVSIQADLCLHKYMSGNILSVSLNKRIILLKKLCFYFDLCSTIYSSNLNRTNPKEYLVYSQLKKPFGNNHGDIEHKHNDEQIAYLINNFQVWKRYILLCHLKYFVKKYKNKFNLDNYIACMLNTQPAEISDLLWKKLNDLKKKVMVIYPELHKILNTNQNITDTETLDPINAINENFEIEKYLKKQFDQYHSAIILLDCIGAIYSLDENRNALKQMERCGPLTIDQYQTLKQCILSSQHIRQHFLANYDLDTLYNSIANISFHDNEININDDMDKHIGISLKHGNTHDQTTTLNV